MATEVIPLKYLANVNERSLPDTTDPDREILYVDIGSVGRGELTDEPKRMRFGDAPTRARRLVQEGDTIVSTVRTYLRAVWPVAGSFDDIVVSTGFAVLTPRDIEPRYLSWWVMSDVFVEEVVARSVGVSYPAVNSSELGEIRVRLPNVDEQRAIADYLDIETNRIDALISKKRRLIELLDKRRAVYVGTAVVAGLGNREDLVETGSQHVPRLPSGWRPMRLRHVAEQIIDTPHKTAPVVDDKKYLVVRTSNVKIGRLVFDDARYTDRASWFEWNRRGEPRPGDVMFTREAPAGEACVVPAGVPLCIGQRMVLFRVNPAVACGEWIVHSIYSGPAQRFIEDLSNATTVAHLNMSDIHDIPIAVPDLNEQQRILARIRMEVRRHEQTVSMLNKQIELLIERRKALITAVVTGEMPVSESSA